MFLCPCSLVSSLVKAESTNTPQTRLDHLYSSQGDCPCSQVVERPQYSKECCYHTARESKMHYTPILTGPMLISRYMRLNCF